MRKKIKSATAAVCVASLMGCSMSMAPENSAPVSMQDRAYPAVSSSQAEMPAAPRQPEAMTFKHYGTNPFISTDEDNLSTFAADVDTGSYSIMRQYIREGNLPPADAVRVEEYIHYFSPNYPAPRDQTFAIQVDGGPSPFGSGYELVRIGIKGKEIPAVDRKPAHLVFVIDVSGSMEQENRLELVKKSLRILVDQLQPSDTVGIVVYGSTGEVILDPTSVEDKKKILASIDRLVPGGSTNAEEGLMLGYEMASRTFDKQAINRVILCSDGVANVGETGPDGILRSIEDYARKDIYLSTFGFGMGNYNDVLMEQLANKGEGNYAYIDSFSEARRIFTEALTGTLQTIARDVKIQVEFDPQKVERYRLLGYENRDVRDEDFRNDAKDAGEIGAGHAVTALYEVKLKTEQKTDLGTVRVRYHDVAANQVAEVAQPVQIHSELSQELQFLATVAEFAEILRESYWAKDSSLEQVLASAEATAQGEQQLEFVRLVKDSLVIKR
ncbi:VWA domain-containing protein [Brevibacillus sp. AY1]|uniref:vWA domain-containing protein n=1 Tax=Brevibacillus sp. AY1 TaxID=2807621 RepID=UPI0024577B38|nr:VWA domain-containing protein [Brevibacillus sp. AY1]MDH4616238.1 VWA domain-containing protein [Brevibacillus sp. AY1]